MSSREEPLWKQKTKMKSPKDGPSPVMSKLKTNDVFPLFVRRSVPTWRKSKSFATKYWTMSSLGGGGVPQSESSPLPNGSIRGGWPGNESSSGGIRSSM